MGRRGDNMIWDLTKSKDRLYETRRGIDGEILERCILEDGVKKRVPLQVNAYSLPFCRASAPQPALARMVQEQFMVTLDADVKLNESQCEIIEKNCEAVIVHETVHAVIDLHTDDKTVFTLDKIDNWSNNFSISQIQ